MLTNLKAAPALALIHAGAALHGAAAVLRAKSPFLARLAIVAITLALVVGDAMAKNRPWAI